MQYLLITNDDENFMKYCLLLKKNIVEENLFSNGGTLHYPNTVFDSDVIIVGYETEDMPLAFIALMEMTDLVYINQIAVKNTHKKQGIGRTLLEKALDYSGDKYVTCHVGDFNKPSQRLFESFGFIKNERRSTSERYYYEFSQIKQIRSNLRK